MNMSLEIKNRRLLWLGHVLRMPEDRIPKVAMMDSIWKKKKRQAKNHLAEESDESWKRWVLHGAKRRPKHGTGLYGEVLLRPYVPDGTKRMSK